MPSKLEVREAPEILRLRHLLDCLDIRLVNLNPSVMNDKAQELSICNTTHALEWIHLQLISP